jgi:spermidine synthase
MAGSIPCASVLVATLDLATYGKADSRVARPEWTRALCVLFFLSGFPALIYQLTWQRALFRIFGVNIESVTIVVTAFMLGLGLGSLLGGLISKRRDVQPLVLLAAIELATGLFGLFSLAIFDRVGDLTAAWPLPAMAAVNLALVIVPTLLMGATLPLLVNHVVRRSGNVGGAVGLLYYVNTLGAGAACLVATVLLFPFLGMQGTVYAAVAMNVAIGAGALAAAWRDTRENAVTSETATHSIALREPALGLRIVLLLAALGGFVALSYEIFLFRTVSYASGSSATAFAATLSAFLVGLASGARQAGENCETLSRPEAMRRLVRSLLLANLLGILFLPVLDHLAWLDRGIIGVAMLMVYLMARAWGCLLPCLAELGVAADGRAGMQTALLYLANIVGSAAGSILTGFVLMDRMSLVSIGVALAILGLVCVALLVAALDLTRPQRRARIALAAALAGVAVLVIPYGSRDVLAKLQWKGSPDAKPIVQLVEDRSGIITADASGTVFGHGMYDGRFNVDLKHDSNGILRPYALSLFHGAPRDVLMIGLSTGSWAQVIANNPEVESLTIVEINAGYLSLIAQAPEVASVLRNPKVNIVIDDGRRWLRRHPQRQFDAIVSNTTWHFRANVTNLLSAEFLAMVKGSLKPGGVFFYNTTDSERVQRTGCLGFAEGARFTNHMILSSGPIGWDFARWRRVLESYRIDGRSLFDPGNGEDRALLDSMMTMATSLAPGAAPGLADAIEPCPAVLARTDGTTPVTDDNMGSEWRYFLGLD